MNKNVTNKIIIFSKYFGYSVGGAEKSIFQILLDKEKSGYEIHVVLITNVITFKAQKLKMDFPSSWIIHPFKISKDSIRFKYFNYFKNKKLIQSFIKNLSNDYILYSYGFFAPAAINIYNGETVYLVRDEYGLGWDKNYYRYIKWIFKNVYKIIEAFWYYKWLKELHLCIKKSNLIANSQFIAKELKKISQKKSITTLCPQINDKQLLKEYKYINNNEVEKGIVFVGDDIIKGSDIVKKIAQKLPNELFYVFDRKYKAREKIKNIVYMPWQKSSIDVYKYAKLVLLPSRWFEAYSRIAHETQILGIPILASNRGGIPESLNYKSDLLIDNIDDIHVWVNKIRKII